MAASTSILSLSSSSLFLSKAHDLVAVSVSVSFPVRSRVGKMVRCQVKSGGKSKPKDSSSKEQKWVTTGMITESLPNGMFWVRLDNGDVVLGYISGKIRRNSIRMLPGDKVKIEVSRYDSTRGRIVYRVTNKD